MEKNTQPVLCRSRRQILETQASTLTPTACFGFVTFRHDHIAQLQITKPLKLFCAFKPTHPQALAQPATSRSCPVRNRYCSHLFGNCQHLLLREAKLPDWEQATHLHLPWLRRDLDNSPLSLGRAAGQNAHRELGATTSRTLSAKLWTQDKPKSIASLLLLSREAGKM